MLNRHQCCALWQCCLSSRSVCLLEALSGPSPPWRHAALSRRAGADDARDHRAYGRSVHARLTEGDGRAAFKPQPALATEWSVSADGLTYSFKLRPGVKWHDGRDFTSADVAYLIKLLKENHPRGRGTFAAVEKVDTPDALTAIIRLTKPAPYLLTALAPRNRRSCRNMSMRALIR